MGGAGGSGACRLGEDAGAVVVVVALLSCSCHAALPGPTASGIIDASLVLQIFQLFTNMLHKCLRLGPPRSRSDPKFHDTRVAGSSVSCEKHTHTW